MFFLSFTSLLLSEATIKYKHWVFSINNNDFRKILVRFFLQLMFLNYFLSLFLLFTEVINF